jgi:radical SAM superfamily enzyme YgiQ (UPF0313 family)
MAYIGAVLRRIGCEVTLLDSSVMAESEIEGLIQSSHYDLFGTGGLFTVFDQIERLLQVNRKYHPKTPALLGGSILTALPDLMMGRMEADIGIIGEGEATIVEIVEMLEKKAGLSGVQGICFKEDGRIINNGKRPVISDIDGLPLPAWDLFPAEHYIENLSADIRFHNPSHRRMDLLAGRSCPFTCNFCYNTLGHPARMRSPESILLEIMVLKELYGITFIQFMDETFLTNRERIKKLCNLLIGERVNISWKCQTRSDTIDYETVEMMREAGCIDIFLGIESGSNKILRNMNKKTTVARNKRAILSIRRAGIEPETAFMFGYPGETEETIQESIQFIEEMDLFVESMNCATPLPSSRLYRDAVRSGLIKDEIEYLRYISNHHMANISFNFTPYDDDRLKELYDRTMARLRVTSMQRNPLDILATKSDGESSILHVRCRACGHFFRSRINSFSLAPVLRCSRCNKCYWVDPRRLPNILSIITRLENRLERFKNGNETRMMIYGAGLHTLYLVHTVSLEGLNLVGYIDSDPNKQGRKFLGKMVHSPEHLLNHGCRAILISTPTFEEEVYAGISWIQNHGVEIIRIYERQEPISQYELLGRFTAPSELETSIS